MLLCMRTTLQIDDQLMQAAKKVAAESGRTLTAVIEDALRKSLAERKAVKKAPPFHLPSLNMGEPMPGVDLDNSAALLDIMEGR